MYCSMITSISLVNIHHYTVTNCFFCDEKLLRCTLLASIKYSTINYSWHAVCYILRTHSRTGGLYLLASFTHLPTPSHHLASISVSMRFAYLFFRILHICVICVFLCLISLSIMPSESIHIVVNGNISFFL